MKRFSMDNCYFDPLMRVIDYEKYNPSGYYRLDLSDARDRETLGKLLEAAGQTKRSFLRNERWAALCGTNALNLPPHH